MAEQHSKSEGVISKEQRRYKVGYITARHADSKTFRTRYYSRHPSLNLKGNWLKEAGFDTGVGVIVKVSERCLTITADDGQIQNKNI
ncbi:type I toxin-antitoxin system SymE family toxin [Pluralibacter gergoviae]|uniref:SymE family type I addiction module toxin n=1 Tax=Pluralibacter gergoviae TaxID=61647 RepID=UPI00092F7A01|nr:SymE family type I addiction module toxin [Pluralibacter gergoviae]ELG9929248.1 type I toxin-antitoxin system SymE family toxin [Pluralibacter gergoviae]ELK5595424.1 type I toxin-antitoxin system SymE family toxin [Pluralibacter gergoviae]ELO7478923.1 type I toxin-antitoxin system SymE family toxin [Pluralibacter gergoviae]ELW9440971.1 type I toxin-antitoxin system SymE family toxin [Pluralibacter gergoviae]MCK1069433.1 type I toxin-antitoxin system SymE family toxin [Pluralibacter gergovia